MKNNAILLGVNIDHVATLRQARLTRYPDPVEAVFAAENGGADGITIHLREDRRHIQERDVELIKAVTQTRLNLEMAVTESMLAYAEKIQPEHICLVPEKRAELTTEGGLDVVTHEAHIHEAVRRLKRAGMEVSLFIDPDVKQIEAALRCDAPVIEIHTGAYADAQTDSDRDKELRRIVKAVHFAHQAGLIVNAGHGLNYQNVQAIAGIAEINELNIGHAIIARAVFIGLIHAVREMKRLMVEARK
ncbi:Pyridoxine 5'-phosphate synthase [Aquicella siphonis]|uniref:Pyridoxine 5'-phosphate synthase n=1 Tax=Aquicella siphonis TaxID=254247 RepID=A0A5E4PH91_9COXI|nr:pyridoxine 5'-phosphate synthase [Aquicella siphonis]VVC75817.1 Pyridoxine 5'-phosphate synthase [Aquicella siphonis]